MKRKTTSACKLKTSNTCVGRIGRGVYRWFPGDELKEDYDFDDVPVRRDFAGDREADRYYFVLTSRGETGWVNVDALKRIRP